MIEKERKMWRSCKHPQVSKDDRQDLVKVIASVETERRKTLRSIISRDKNLLERFPLYGSILETG